jgi:hypothetical protein
VIGSVLVQSFAGHPLRQTNIGLVPFSAMAATDLTADPADESIILV